MGPTILAVRTSEEDILSVVCMLCLVRQDTVSVSKVQTDSQYCCVPNELVGTDVLVLHVACSCGTE